MTTVRLAYNRAENQGLLKSLSGDEEMTTVRMAWANGQGCRGNAFTPPTVRLAFGDRKAEEMAIENRGDEVALADRPALLVSYVYLEPFLQNQPRYLYRDWVMDSGAFSAHNSGKIIHLQDYINTCKQLMERDKTLTEVFALDVIGDWKAGLQNCEEMWKQGVPAIPCYHVGEPEHVLKTMARDYPKIALGGAVGYRNKDKWAEQCFSRIWPKKVHGFGYGAEKSIMSLPWHSCDASNWELGPCKFGRWASLGALKIRGSNQDLRGEVKHYLEIEKKAQRKWAGAMKQLEGSK